MQQIWNDFFTEQNIYVLKIGGLYLLIFGFGKFMEIRQDKKKAQTIKKAKCHQCAIKEAQRDDSELSKMPPFLG
jgi:hypothetical protein